MNKWMIVFLLAIVSLAATCGEPAPAPKLVQESETGITHTFVVFGGATYVVGKDSTITHRYPFGTRDGWMLPNGNLLSAVSKNKEYPGGAIVEVDKDGKKVFEFKGSQVEVHSVQPLENGNIVMTEGGPKPKLMEITREGKVVVEFALKCQVPNAHMQTRMARKLPNGNYLAPHLLDRVVREYKPDGTVVSEIKTPDEPKDSWPFTAIRLDNGNTLINCTHGNMVQEVDKDGKVVWQLTNKDLPSPMLADPCGAQRLANGNTIICSYGAGKADAVKAFEVTPDKKVVWTFKTNNGDHLHEIHVIDPGEKSLK
ncbi:MAG: hypothetical protein WCT04_15290 [Planctomycetota bacterium]